jgi:hypothetical protein
VTSHANVLWYIVDAFDIPAALIVSPVIIKQVAVAESAIRPIRPLPIELIALPFWILWTVLNEPLTL